MSERKHILQPITETRTIGYKAIPVYRFTELPKSVQLKVADNEYQHRDASRIDYLPWIDDNVEDLERIADIFNLEIDIKQDPKWLMVDIVAEDNSVHVNMCDVKGSRAYKYIVNNYLPCFKSAMFRMDEIPLEVWEGMKRSIVRKRLSVFDYIQGVVDAYEYEINKTIEYYFSKDGVMDELVAFDDYYTIDGKFVDMNDVQ